MPRRTEPARTYPSFAPVRCGPWEGVTDTVEPQTARPNRAQLMRNCYATTTDTGVAVVGVPGFVKVGSQLGSGGARAAQWVGQYNTTLGVKKSVVIVNGTIIEYDHGTDAFTTVVSAANFATATITISTTARIYCVVFNDKLVVSDGVNKPFSWDGTAGAGGLTPLSNAPVAFGQPVVYYFKLFFIKATEPDTIVWSEEGLENTGYEAGGYANAWNLGGTKGEKIVALPSTNEYLGLSRPRSATTITGAVNDQFKTTGTRNAVSERVGTNSPGGTLVLDEGTLLVDADGKPQFWWRGSGFEQNPPLWADCETTVRPIPRITLTNVEIIPDDQANLIWVGLPETSQTYCSKFLLFERTGGRPNFVGEATDFVSQRTGVWEDSEGVPRIVHCGVDDGYVYLHGTPDGSTWSYGFNAGTLAINHTLTFVVPDASIKHDKYYDRLTIESSADDDQVLTVDVQTPEGVTDTQSFTLEGSGSGLVWDMGNWDDEDWAGSGIDQKVDCNVNARGRWALVRIRHGAVGSPFNITQAEIETFVDGREPAVR